MKNVLLAASLSYIFYGFCEIRAAWVPVIVFGVFLAIVVAVDETFKDFKESVKRRQRLNRSIERLKA